MTDSPKKYEPQNQADPNGYGLPLDRDPTPEEMEKMPKSVLLRYVCSQQYQDARRERERQAAMQQQQPAPRTFTPEEIARMPLSDLLTLRDTHQGGQG